jgi:hypothetical protein
MVRVCSIIIEKIWSPFNNPPLSNGNQIFQSQKNDGNEGFPKTYDTPPFSGDWKVSIDTKKGDQKNFDHYDVGDQKILVITRFGN